jgi:hypothetical protein
MEPELDMFDEWKLEDEKKPWYTKKIESISTYLMKISDFIDNIPHGIKNIQYWFPIIWKDRNWDSDYIFEILKHKLKAQSEYIRNKNRHTSSKRDAEMMMTCVNLIKLIQEEKYNHESLDYHKTKYWTSVIPESPNLYQFESRIVEENFDDYFIKYPLIYKRVMKGEGPFSLKDREDKKEVIASNIEYINHNRAKKLLFKIMERHIERWWD